MDANVSFPEHWTAPRELMRALPRETHLSGRGIFSAILGAIFFLGSLVLGIFLHNDGIREGQEAAALRADGKEATAEIYRLWHQGKGSTPMVAYRFSANGSRISGESSVPSKSWPGIQKIGFLTVRYLPSNPIVNHPTLWDPPTQPAWFPFVIPSVWAIGSIVMLVVVGRQRKVAAEGVPTVGVVTRSFRVKGGWVARYQFRTPDGAVLKGRDRITGRTDPGAAVCVLYLPDNPKRNYLYPMTLYRVAL